MPKDGHTTPLVVAAARRGASSEAPSALAGMWTNIYVDGFNLYYGALKNTPWKWFDLSTLFRLVLKPHHRVATIKYFTARVRPTPNDPSKANRQYLYIETLSRQCPQVNIHFGHFLSHVVPMPRAPEGTGTVNVTM